MNPVSHQALMKLAAFGMEELSTAEAAQLLSAIEQCPECQGEWILFHKTICHLSQAADDVVDGDCSQKMWLVCLEHAQQKHTFEISGEHHISSDGHAALDGHASRDGHAGVSKAARTETASRA